MKISKITEMINKLKQTTKRNEKLQILKEYKDDKIKKILFYTYNPLYMFHLKKTLKCQREGKYTIDDVYDEMFELLDNLRRRVISGNNALNITKSFMEKLTPPERETFKCILNKDLKCSVNIKTINKVYDNMLIESDFQLANKFDPEKDYGVDEWLWSYKLDGIRMRVKVDDMIPFGRNSKPIKNTEFMLEELQQITNEFREIDFFDGEIYVPGLEFNKIQSMISKDDLPPDRKYNLKYFIFITLPKNYIQGENDREVIELTNRVKEYCKNNLKIVKVLEQKLVKNDINEIYRLREEAIRKGFEGIMLRNPNKIYDFKRSDALLKFKKFHTADLEVVGVEKGIIKVVTDDTLKEVETLGALICKGWLDDGKGKKWIETKVGSGFTFNERMNIYENPDKYIGKMVEVEYFELTKNKNRKDENIYSLRFPVFKRWREDRDNIL